MSNSKTTFRLVGLYNALYVSEAETTKILCGKYYLMSGDQAAHVWSSAIRLCSTNLKMECGREITRKLLNSQTWDPKYIRIYPPGIYIQTQNDSHRMREKHGTSSFSWSVNSCSDGLVQPWTGSHILAMCKWKKTGYVQWDETNPRKAGGPNSALPSKGLWKAYSLAVRIALYL